ncbi:MAG TPA: histidine phosphatase family protein [Bryobacteraceae bacterium]|nr:histidine phosphatase family protein [Bryobacteraceae bacterium]
MLTGVLLGHTDPPLSAEGRREIANVDINAAVGYTSPLRRCAESASLVARRNTPVLVIQDLREISFGEWDGLAWQQIEQRWPAESAAKLRNWLGITPPGGESRESFVERLDAVLLQVRSGPMPAAIVAHQAVNARLAYLLSGSEELTFQQAYGEVYEYTI